MDASTIGKTLGSELGLWASHDYASMLTRYWPQSEYHFWKGQLSPILVLEDIFGLVRIFARRYDGPYSGHVLIPI